MEYENITIKQLLEDLTNENLHSDRVLIEAILSQDDELINRACKVRVKHSEDGYLTNDNMKERQDIINKLNECQVFYKG